MVVHLDDEAIGSGGDAGARHGQHTVAAAGAVAGIDENGKVADVLKGGNDAEVEDALEDGVGDRAHQLANLGGVEAGVAVFTGAEAMA